MSTVAACRVELAGSMLIHCMHFLNATVFQFSSLVSWLRHALRSLEAVPYCTELTCVVHIHVAAHILPVLLSASSYCAQQFPSSTGVCP